MYLIYNSVKITYVHGSTKSIDYANGKILYKKNAMNSHRDPSLFNADLILFNLGCRDCFIKFLANL